MRLKFRLLALSGIAAFTLQGCVKQTSVEEAAAPVAPLTVAEQGGTGEGPALWKLADEDTTIYLFGTVHMLPENVDWYKGPISTALGGAGEVVTEISTGAMKDPGVQADMAMKAMLPVDQNLQSLLNEQDREAYRAAMTKIDLPPATFDRFEPWFVGMSLAVLPLLKSGWNPESGVENIVDQSARKGAKRTALETVDAQLSMFDNLPQIANRVYDGVGLQYQIHHIGNGCDGGRMAGRRCRRPRRLDERRADRPRSGKGVVV